MKRIKRYMATALAALLLLGCAVLSFHSFADNVAAVSGANVIAVRTDAARQQALTLSGKLEQPLNVLGAVSGSLRDMPREQVLSVLEKVREEQGFERAGMQEGNGTAVYTDGQRVPERVVPEGLTQAGVFRRIADDRQYIVFAAAYGENGFLFAWYPEEYFADVLANLDTGKGSLCYIADASGSVISQPGHADYISFFGNVLTLYGEAVLRSGSVEQAAGDLAAGNAGSVSYDYGNQSRVDAYAPLGVNDWFLFSTADAGQADAQGNVLNRQIMLLAARLLILAALAVLICIVQNLNLKEKVRKLSDTADISAALHESAKQLSYTILFEADPATGQITYNDAFERQLGHKPTVTNLNAFLKEGAENPLPPDIAPAWRSLAEEMKRGVAKSQVSVQLPNTNGENLWYRVSFKTLYSPDKTAPVRIVGRLANIEWQEQEQDRELARAEHDELTGLLGHMAFMRQAEKALKREKAGTLLIVDIDGFKRARSGGDDQYEGDRLLMCMSKALGRVFGGSDLLGRLGGDTFAVLMWGHVPPEEAARRAGMLCRTFEETAKQTCSVGIAMYSDEAQTVSELSHRADKALYRAKLAGKHRYEFYEGPITDQMTEVHWGSDANLALNRCAVSLLTCDALAVGVDETLQEIARYYRADRSYILQVDADKTVIRTTFSWSAPDQEPAEDDVLPLDGDSLLSRAYREHRALSVSEISEKTVSDPNELARLRERHVAGLYMAPMNRGGAIVGYLGIENPKDHVGNATLLKQVSSCLASAVTKFNKTTHE